MVNDDISLEKIETNLRTSFAQLDNLLPIHKLGNGWGSVAVEGNNKVVFRIAKNEHIQKLHKEQVKILPIIAAELKGVEVPLPEYYVESSHEFPFGVMGYRKIEGSIFNPRELSQEDLVYLASQMASLLIKFHQMQTTDELKNNLSVTDYSEQKLQQTWDTASEWLKAHLSEKEYSMADKWWKKMIQFFVNHPSEPVLVHGDPWYENIILDDQLHIKAIVDFDKVSLGDPAIDFVVQQYVSKDFMNNVISEYKKLGGKLGDHFEKRVKLLTGIKAIEDLNYCLYINYIYPDTLEEIIREIVEDTSL